MGEFEGKKVLVTGATGLIGSGLVNKLMKFDNINVIAISRSEEKLRKCFSEYLNYDNFSYIEHDVSYPFSFLVCHVDYIFHAAGSQENKIISETPVDVINANLYGTINCLEVLRKQKISSNVIGRLILFSSITIYGNNSNKDQIVKEDNTSLTEVIESKGAPYSQSKRMSEVIVRAYVKQFGLDAVISRLSTVYGDTVFKTDTAFFEFISKAISGEDLFIKTTMLPRRDNIYLEDAISGLLTIALKGKTNEVYNISSNGDLGNFIAVDEIAHIIADEVNKRNWKVRSPINVIYHHGKISKRKPGLILDNSKLKDLGWILSNSIHDGIAKTLDSLNL
jgi:nucleoside-diphosphate-sugar epimerase